MTVGGLLTEASPQTARALAGPTVQLVGLRRSLANASAPISIQSVTDLPVYQEVNARHGMIPSVTKTEAKHDAETSAPPSSALPAV